MSNCVSVIDQSINFRTKVTVKKWAFLNTKYHENIL